MTRVHVWRSLTVVALASAVACCANEKFTTVGEATADGSIADSGSSVDGGSSEAASACPDVGAEVVFPTRGANQVLAVDFPPMPLVSRFSDKLSGGPCPMAFDPEKVPYRSFLVQNATGATVQLSAWAVCKAGDDAFLAFYKRSSPPVSDLEVPQCVGFVSEGASGQGGRTSPDANTSAWCPGLTVANGGALALAPCEAALVFLENFEKDPKKNAPARLHIQAD
jgi:hypothetical protein